MASKIKKNFGATITGIYNIEDGVISIDVENFGSVSLAEFTEEFKEKEVKVTIAYSDDPT